jgi:hypothetical protein
MRLLSWEVLLFVWYGWRQSMRLHSITFIIIWSVQLNLIAKCCSHSMIEIRLTVALIWQLFSRRMALCREIKKITGIARIFSQDSEEVDLVLLEKGQKLHLSIKSTLQKDTLIHTISHSQMWRNWSIGMLGPPIFTDKKSIVSSTYILENPS